MINHWNARNACSTNYIHVGVIFDSRHVGEQGLMYMYIHVDVHAYLHIISHDCCTHYIQCTMYTHTRILTHYMHTCIHAHTHMHAADKVEYTNFYNERPLAHVAIIGYGRLVLYSF